MLTFEEIYERQIPRRLERLQRLLTLNAPGVIVGHSFALLLEALTAKYGERVWEQIVRLMIDRMMEAQGWCAFHTLGVGGETQKRIVLGEGMCAECVGKMNDEEAAEVAAEEADGREPVIGEAGDVVGRKARDA